MTSKGIGYWDYARDVFLRSLRILREASGLQCPSSFLLQRRSDYAMAHLIPPKTNMEPEE